MSRVGGGGGGFAHVIGIQQTPADKNLWIKNLLAEICHLSTQRYKDLFRQARSSRFLYVGFS